MKIEYFPDVDALSFLFIEGGEVADGRDVEGDDDIVVMYNDQNRVVEILVHNASKRMALESISATIVTGQEQPA